MSIYRYVCIHVGWETLSLCAHFPFKQLVLRLPANISARQAGNTLSLLGMSWGHGFFFVLDAKRRPDKTDESC